MNLEYLTLSFLVVLFLGAEIFRALSRGLRGVIVAVEDDAEYPLSLLVTLVRVRLTDGRDILASMNCCTACIGRFAIGDEVRVRATGEGFVIDLPWFKGTGCNPTDKSGIRMAAEARTDNS